MRVQVAFSRSFCLGGDGLTRVVDGVKGGEPALPTLSKLGHKYTIKTECTPVYVLSSLCGSAHPFSLLMPHFPDSVEEGVVAMVYVGAPRGADGEGGGGGGGEGGGAQQVPYGGHQQETSSPPPPPPHLKHNTVT